MQPNSVTLATWSLARANWVTPPCATSTIVRSITMSQEPEA
jgi:hypothetical protein